MGRPSSCNPCCVSSSSSSISTSNVACQGCQDGIIPLRWDVPAFSALSVNICGDSRCCDWQHVGWTVEWIGITTFGRNCNWRTTSSPVYNCSSTEVTGVVTVVLLDTVSFGVWARTLRLTFDPCPYASGPSAYAKAIDSGKFSQAALAKIDCLGSHVLSLSGSANNLCSGWPSTITIAPSP